MIIVIENKMKREAAAVTQEKIIFAEKGKGKYKKEEVDNYVKKISIEYDAMYRELTELTKSRKKPPEQPGAENAALAEKPGCRNRAAPKATAKSLDAINSEFILQSGRGSERSPAKIARGPCRAAAIVSDVIFYAALLATVLTTLAGSSGRGGAPRTVFGYSYLHVLTASMQKEIPKGSFIIVKVTDPGLINIGDDITYMSDKSTSVTHRVVGIREGFTESGSRGFITQGVNNTSPDDKTVPAENVVGVVRVVVPGLGAALAGIGENLYLLLVMLGLFTVLSFALRALFSKPPDDGAVLAK
jgi:signal peptidase I